MTLKYLEKIGQRSEVQVVCNSNFGILKIELTILTWDRAIHEGNYPLYVETLLAVEWLFHALDHYKYARAVAVHLRDMLTLHDRHPVMYE